MIKRQFRLMFVLSIAGISFAFNGNSQTLGRTSLNAFGNTVSSSQVTLSQTVGQASNTNIITTSDGIEIRQGFQQAQFRVKASDKNELQFTLFPNPNNGTFQIQFHERESGTIRFRLSNQQGSVIDQGEIDSYLLSKMSYRLASGVYYLTLVDSNGKSGITKIIIF